MEVERLRKEEGGQEEIDSKWLFNHVRDVVVRKARLKRESRSGGDGEKTWPTYLGRNRQ